MPAARTESCNKLAKSEDEVKQLEALAKTESSSNWMPAKTESNKPLDVNEDGVKQQLGDREDEDTDT